MGTFGRVEIEVPCARLNGPGGKTTEWNSQVLRAYQRRTLAADALIASTYLAGTNTRRVRRALKALFGGAVGKDTVSRVWRKVKADWDAWNARSLAADPIVRRSQPAHQVRRPLVCRGFVHLLLRCFVQFGGRKQRTVIIDYVFFAVIGEPRIVLLQKCKSLRRRFQIVGAVKVAGSLVGAGHGG
jgi:Transposase, Mutator family